MAGAALAAALWLSGCSKKEAAPEQGPPPGISDSEIALGTEACQRYAERVCACQKSGDGGKTGGAPGGVEDCELARSRVEALELAVRGARAARNKPKDRGATEYNARKIMEQCVQADLNLDPQVCPRP